MTRNLEVFVIADSLPEVDSLQDSIEIVFGSRADCHATSLTKDGTQFLLELSWNVDARSARDVEMKRKAIEDNVGKAVACVTD